MIGIGILEQNKLIISTPSYLDNIVSYWQFENNVLDSVGSNNGTATSITYVTGQVGNAAVFNGTTSNIEIADDNSLSFGNGTTDSAFSINFSFKFTSVASVVFVCKKSKTDGQNIEYQIDFDGSNYNLQLFDNNTTNRIVNVYNITPTSGVQYTGTLTYDASGTNAGLKFYLNGILQTASSTSNLGTYVAMENLNEPLIFGKNAQTTTRILNGQLDEITIFNKELSATEVSEIYTTLNAGNHLI